MLILTGLTLGGFIQPSIAQNLLEQPANVEKGLCQTFLWFVAKPTPVPFDDLEKVNRDFSASIGTYIQCTYTHVLNVVMYRKSGNLHVKYFV